MSIRIFDIVTIDWKKLNGEFEHLSGERKERFLKDFTLSLMSLNDCYKEMFEEEKEATK